jgi:hypothetical protein
MFACNLRRGRCPTLGFYASSSLFGSVSYFDYGSSMTRIYKKSRSIFSKIKLDFINQTCRLDGMDFTTTEKTHSELGAIRCLKEIYLGREFTGTDIERALVMMMMLNKQGSVGVEEILCEILGLTQNNSKHGFDGVDLETGIMYELKPSKEALATYNDVTPEKINTMTNTVGNTMIFEVHTEGRLKFIAEVSGKLVAEILFDLYTARKENIKKGKSEGSRQTHKVSLHAFIKRFGAGQVNVLFYDPDGDPISKNNKKALGLVGPINKLDF